MSSTVFVGSIISLYIPHAAAFISLALNLTPSTIASNLPVILAASPTPITASRLVEPTIRPLRLIASVIIGAGSPLDVPFLIAVVSAMLRATLPGGTLCFAFAASSRKSAFKSGSNPLMLSSNCSKLLAVFLSIAAWFSAFSKYSNLR